MSSTQLVWLITGTSSGFGRDLAIAALNRGDKVIATARARSSHRLDELKSKGADVLQLDVTASLEELHTIAKTAVAIHGRVDVLVNNAGYIAEGALEENTPEETLAQFNTNVFGGLNVARAFLPYMREKKTGTLVLIGSLGGWKVFPTASLYCASKHTIRALSEGLHQEIEPLGLRSIVFEPGYFRTDFLKPGNRAGYTARISDYAEMNEQAHAGLTAYNGHQPGDPKKGVEVMVDVVRGEGSAAGKPFPLVLALGSDCHEATKTACEQTLARLEEWKEVTCSTDF